MPGVGFILARIWYILLGGIATLIGVGSLIGPIAGGCRIAFTQADMERPGPCIQYLDPIFLVVSLSVGATMLAAGLLVASSGGAARLVAAIGIGAGVLASLVPAWIIVWAIGFYRLTPGPSELIMAGVPTLLGMAAALAMARAWWRAPRRSTPSG